MKFQTAALKFLVASKALHFGVRAQSIVVDRTSDTNVADAAVSDVLLERDSGGRFFPTGINNLRVVDSVTRGDGSISKTGTMHDTVADAAVSDVLLERDSGGRFFPTGINNLRVVDSVTRGDGSISKTGIMHHTVADAAVSDVFLETATITTFSTPEGFTASSSSSAFLSSSSSSLVDAKADVVDRKSENNGSTLLSSSSLEDANAIVVDHTSENNGDSGVSFSPNGINNLRVVVDPVTRGDRTSSTTGTRPHIVASDVLIETLPVDSGGRLSSTGMDALAANDVLNLYLHAVVDAINDDDEISSFTGSDGDTVSTQRKLSKSSKKVKHPEALCTLSLFAGSLFMYRNQCFTDIMVTISACDDQDDTCYISERLPLLPEEQEENQEEEQCFVGGSFSAKQNIQYNPSTGECEFLYVDLADDPCNLYTGDTGTGSLGLKAWINVKNNPDVMFIQFTKDKGLTFYNAGDERVAKKLSPTQDNRYLRQEGATKPVLSMMPHAFASRRLYYAVAIKNDTPYEANFARIEYCACAKDENSFIASGGTWTADYRGACLVTEIHSTLIVDGREVQCSGYFSSGTGISEFFLMWIDDVCCLRSSQQSNTECTDQQKGLYPKVQITNDTPYEVNFARIEYAACADDENNFIASGGTWTARTYRGACLVTWIHSTLILPDGTGQGRVLECVSYRNSGTGKADFYIMWIGDVCCLRSWDQCVTECTDMYGEGDIYGMRSLASGRRLYSKVSKKRSPTHNDDRYLRQEGATKPVLLMMPYPFASRRLFIYPEVSVKNDTPYKVNSIRVEYRACANDEHEFISSGGTWTAETYRGGCLVTEIHSTLIIDDREQLCRGYFSSGTSFSEFYIMWIDDFCCLRSSKQSDTKCTDQCM